MKKLNIVYFLLSFILGANLLQAQLQKPDTSANELLKKIKIGFFFNGGYSKALSDNTNANGSYFDDSSAESDNSFFVRYARINGKYEFSPHWKVDLLANLADFKKSNVSTKVLEIASLTYSHNSYLNIRLAQFRPYFGVEDTYGASKQMSNYWSNSYLMMSRSNWQSFQLGVSLYGNLSASNIPLKYYFNLYNGNGKNQIIDNDDAKNFSTRLEGEIFRGIKIGANYALSQFNDENTQAYGFDLQTKHEINSNFSIQTESQYLEGNNMYELYHSSQALIDVDNYKFKNWYITPQLRYETNQATVKALEFSCRYEDVTANKEIDTHQITITPQLSFIFENNNNVKASIGAILNQYENDDNSIQTLPDSDVLYMQLQLNY